MATRERQQSTTTYPIYFLMVDGVDHLTGKTGLTPTVTLSKNGAGYGAAAGAVSEVANGLYKVAGNATDSNTLGELWLHATATGADPTDIAYTVVAYDPFATPANAADVAAIKALLPMALTADGNIKADSLRIGGTPQTGRDLGASVLLSSGTGTGQLSLSAGAVLMQATQSFSNTGTWTGNISGSVGSVTAAVLLPTIPTDWIGAVGVSAAAVTKVQSGLATPTNITAGTVTTVVNLTNAPTAGDLTAAMKTSITTAATAATPTAAAVTADVGITQAAADKVWATTTRTLSSFGTLVSDAAAAVWALATRTITALPALPTDWLTAAAVKADAVAKIQSGLSTYAGADPSGVTTLLTRVSGNAALASQIPANFTAATFASAGVFATAALANAPTGGGGGISAADVWTYSGTRALTDKSGFSPSPTQNANATLDALQSDHIGSGTIGASIKAAGNAGDPWSPTMAVLEAYSTDSAANLLLKLNVGAASQHVAPLPVPTPNADDCIVWVDTKDITQLVTVGAAVTFKLNGPAQSGGVVLSQDVKTAYTDALGRAAIILCRNDMMTPGNRYYEVSCDDFRWVNLRMVLNSDRFDMAGMAS